MTVQKLLTQSAIAMASTLAFAGTAIADTEWHYENSEAGARFYPNHGPKSTVTREQAKQEAILGRQFGAGKVSPDGWRFVGGERGWVFEGHKIEYRDGKWVHVDGIDKTAARASPKMTAKEKAQFEAQYGQGSN
ncbi:MAG: hypothetical protein ABL985_01905 [Casimicrobium sp.]